jgi:hypothetical protein
VPLGFGKSYQSPASIAFTEMDQGEFAEFFDRVVHLLRTEVVPGMPEDFAAEFEALLVRDGSKGAGGAERPARAA